MITQRMCMNVDIVKNGKTFTVSLPPQAVTYSEIYDALYDFISAFKGIEKNAIEAEQAAMEAQKAAQAEADKLNAAPKPE